PISGLTGSPLLRPAELLASQLETFTSGLSMVWSPSPLPDMTTVATGQFPPAGLSPPGSAASGPAQCVRLHNQQRITPIAEPSTCQNPRAPIGVSQARPRMPTLQHH